MFKELLFKYQSAVVKAGVLLISVVFVSCEENNWYDPASTDIYADFRLGRITVFNDGTPAYNDHLLAIGYSDSAGNGNRRGIIAQFDGAANVDWSHHFRDEPVSELRAIEYNRPTKSYFVVAEGNPSDPLLYELDHNGNIINRFQLPFTGSECIPRELIISSNGNLIIGGTLTDGKARGFLTCLTLSGKELWTVYSEESEWDSPCTAVEKVSGFFLLAGYVDEMGSGELKRTAWLWKVDESGGTIFFKMIPIQNYTIVGLYSPRDTAYSLIGTTMNTKSLRPSTRIVSIDNENGDFQWQSTFSHTSFSTPDSLFTPMVVFGGYACGELNGTPYIFSGWTWTSTYSIHRPADFSTIARVTQMRWFSSYGKHVILTGIQDVRFDRAGHIVQCSAWAQRRYLGAINVLSRVKSYYSFDVDDSTRIRETRTR